MRPSLIAAMLGAGVAIAALVVPASAAVPSDHARAVAALTDIRAAITSIMNAENDTSSGPNDYLGAAHSAINALVGRQSRKFDAAFATKGDAVGAIGQVNHLLDRTANPPFVTPLHGVLINLIAAEAYLDDAVKARGLTKFETAASDALENLEIAQGRPGQYDVLGGMMGAIANTSLGLPDGAATENACAAPRHAGYGVTHGWLAWRAVEPGDAPIPVGDFAHATKENGMLVLYTAAAPMVRHHCAHAAAPAAATHAAVRTHAAAQAVAHRAALRVTRRSPLLIEAAAKSGGAPSYTMAQATAGKAIYAQNCASCHGANLQGVAAPAIAGKDFITTAQKNNYTVSILRTIVTQNMPFNNPGSLSPTQYANVLAFLLASNCYPAGKTAFPEHAPANFGTAKFAPPAKPAGKPDKFGVCPVG